MTAPDENEIPGELPPLEGDDGRADELADDELGELITPPLREEGEEDRDDDLDTDRTFDLELLPEAPGEPEGEAELNFDSSELLVHEEARDPSDDDALGTEDFGAASSLSEWQLDGDADDANASEDVEDLVDESALPELDADEAGDDDDERWGSLEMVSSDVVLARAPEPWPMRLALQERCSPLTVSEGVCAVGSADLIWFDGADATPVRTAIDGTRISSLALVGREPKIALCVTGFGRLSTRTRTGSSVEKIAEWRRAAAELGVDVESLELCQVGLEASHSVIARLTSGQLLRSDDAGLSWQALDGKFTTFAISSLGSPLVALSHSGARLSVTHDAGKSWEHVALTAPALAVAHGEAPILAASGSVIAIAEAERGLVVSADAGREFRVIAGLNNATALTAGIWAERPTIWAALYHETSDRSSIALVDVMRGEASVIGDIEPGEPLDPDGPGERGRVERLLWDGNHLWASGGFGVAVWSPSARVPIST